MEIRFEKKFLKQLSKVNDSKTAKAIKEAILTIEQASSLSDIHNLKKLVGYKSAYRIKLNEYRIGIVVEDGTIDFVCFMHRKEIYKYFP